MTCVCDDLKMLYLRFGFCHAFFENVVSVAVFGPFGDVYLVNFFLLLHQMRRLFPSRPGMCRIRDII